MTDRRKLPARRQSKAALERLVEEATLDAYGESEQVTGLLTMIEEHLEVPFAAKILGLDVTVERVDLRLRLLRLVAQRLQRGLGRALRRLETLGQVGYLLARQLQVEPHLLQLACRDQLLRMFGLQRRLAFLRLGLGQPQLVLVPICSPRSDFSTRLRAASRFAISRCSRCCSSLASKASTTAPFLTMSPYENAVVVEQHGFDHVSAPGSS